MAARQAVHGAPHNLPLDDEDPVLWVTEILLYHAAIRTLTLLRPGAPKPPWETAPEARAVLGLLAEP